VEIFLMYGQTEASARLSYLPTEELKRRPKSIGKGMPGVLLEVLNSAGSPAGVGEEGEIVACGENLMSGYWGDSEATRQALRDGKLWTADLATVDEEGFIHITGRRSDLIKTGAYRVHPEEIEETIVSMDGVHECVVVGVPDETWGETIVACFLEGTSPPIADIRKHLRGVLPEYKWPRDVVEVEELPRTTSGKPKRRELVKMLISGNPGGAPAEVRGAKPHHD
jgi:acyl-CoA synthetase (AMP-forming)/AMP-acid ligase II